MKTQEVVIGGKTSFDIFLEEETTAMDEIQVIAYGTTTKRLNTSTIATVKSAEIESRPVTNVLQALQGQVAGVSFQQSASGIGSPMEIIIRGQNSFSSGTNPLIIVDGVVVNSDPGGLIAYDDASTTGGGANYMTSGVSPLNFMNMNDIESVDILKDADATSIYGSRGSNGVILITTKKAQLGEAKYSFNVSTGLSSATGLIKRMNTPDYLKMRKDAFAMGNATAESAINPITPDEFYAPDLTVWDQNAYTDWPDYEMGNTAPLYNASGQVTGGSKIMNFLASFGYSKKYDVIYNKPNMERLTGRLVLGHTSKDNKFKVNLNSTFGNENQKFTNTSLTSTNSTYQVNVPNYQMYNSDGSLYIPFGQYTTGYYRNPIPLSNMSNNSKTGNLLLSADASYEIIKGLKAKVLLSYDLQSNEYHSIFPSTATSAQTDMYYPDPYGTHTTNKYTAFNFEPMLTYDVKISKGTLSALVGGTMLDRQSDMTGITVNNPGSDALLYSYASGNPTTSNSNTTYYKFSSIYGRLTYNWDAKYLLNLTYRRDGSSRFGPNNKFGNFGSVGAGWIFSEEKFIKNSLSFLSFGKLRGSYGTTGSDNIGDYLYTSLLSSSPYDEYATNSLLIPTALPNPAIQWEKTTKMDIGLELGFFKGRVMLNTTWYKSSSDNLLVDMPLPSTTGYSSIKSNFEGVVQNTGMEFTLTTFNLAPANAFQWKTSFNLAFNANKLTSFPGLENTPYATRYEIGRAIPSSSMSGSLEMPMHFTGIDPANGMPIFEDVNGDGIADFSDMSINEAWIGSGNPTIWGGLGNNFTWNGFGLDIFIQFSKQLMSKWNCNAAVAGNLANPSVDISGNYWKQPGDVSKYPRLYSGVPGDAEYTDPLTYYYGWSTACIADQFYFRLKNIQLTYNLPKSSLQHIGLDGVMLYLRGENLAVYTKEKLYKDPELYWSNTAPILRTFTIGGQFNF